MPKVSVIIPIHNTAAYLPRCMKSVLGQTLTGIEVIAIDDASTDGSKTVVERFAAQDDRVRVIALPRNRGAGFARNTGIDAACGEYLGFVDSDDFVDADFFEKLTSTGADVALGDIVEEVYEGDKVVETLNEGYESELRADVHQHRVAFIGRFPMAVYRRSLIIDERIRFKEGRTWGEDRLFPLAAALAADRIEVIDGSHYHYCFRPDILTRRELTRDDVEGQLAYLSEIADFIESADLAKSERLFLISRVQRELAFDRVQNTPYADRWNLAAKEIKRRLLLSGVRTLRGARNG